MSGNDQIATMTVSDVLTRWPETAAVFHRYNMACVGCPVAPFYSVSEAAQVYNLPADEFVALLEKVIKEGPAS